MHMLRIYIYVYDTYVCVCVCVFVVDRNALRVRSRHVEESLRYSESSKHISIIV